MQVKLSKSLEEYVRDQVDSGKYASADDVIRKALVVMKNVEKILPSAEDDLRREINIGIRDIEEGRVSDWNPEETKRRIRAQAERCSFAR
jgi:antitoxin ParD1/3/4